MRAVQAETALKLVRETISGIKALREAGKFDLEVATHAAIALKKALVVLDLWLTDELDHRNALDDVLLVRFLSGDDRDCRLVLSDQRTVLVMSWKGRPVSLAEIEVVRVNVIGRWRRINSEASNPEEFPENEHA